MVFLFLRVNWSLQCSTCAVCFISLENGPKDSLEQRKRAYCSCVWDWKHQTMENKEGVVCHLPGDFYRNCDLPCCLFLFHFFFLSEGKKNGKTLGYYFDLILICHSVLETNQTIRGSMKLPIMCFHHLFYSTCISSVLHFYLNLLVVLLSFSSYWISNLKTNEAVSIVDLDAWQLVKVNTHTLKSWPHNLQQ